MHFFAVDCVGRMNQRRNICRPRRGSGLELQKAQQSAHRMCLMLAKLIQCANGASGSKKSKLKELGPMSMQLARRKVVIAARQTGHRPGRPKTPEQAGEIKDLIIASPPPLVSTGNLRFLSGSASPNPAQNPKTCPLPKILSGADPRNRRSFLPKITAPICPLHTNPVRCDTARPPARSLPHRSRARPHTKTERTPPWP